MPCSEWGELLLMHGRCRLPQSKPQLLLPTQRERRRPRLEVRLHRVARGRVGAANDGVPAVGAGGADGAEGGVRGAAVQGLAGAGGVHLLLALPATREPADGEHMHCHRQRGPHHHLRALPHGLLAPLRPRRPRGCRGCPLQDRCQQGVAALPGGAGGGRRRPERGADGADHQVQQGHPLLQVHHHHTAPRSLQKYAAAPPQEKSGGDARVGQQRGDRQHMVRGDPGARGHVRQNPRGGLHLPHVQLQGGGHVCCVLHEDVPDVPQHRGAH
mmetsp:Transcript_10337/g.24446  ORF Transcript_10337/g.24446 Transcript_10337/m.24446 type:complete len:271 (-) Transcript_10337:477-1289(-)